MESAATAMAYRDGVSIFRNNVVHTNNATEFFRVDSAANTVITKAQVEAKALAEGNVKQATAEGVLTSPFSLTSPNFAPVAGGPAASGVGFTGLDNTFFTTTTFKGAVGTENWLQGWTRFVARGQ